LISALFWDVEWNRFHYYWCHYWMMMGVEQSVECLAGETEILGENLLQCRFVHHKSHMSWTGLESGLRHGLRWNLTFTFKSSFKAVISSKSYYHINYGISIYFTQNQRCISIFFFTLSHS
jgi:hypothetical protein